MDDTHRDDAMKNKHGRTSRTTGQGQEQNKDKRPTHKGSNESGEGPDVDVSSKNSNSNSSSSQRASSGSASVQDEAGNHSSEEKSWRSRASDLGDQASSFIDEHKGEWVSGARQLTNVFRKTVDELGEENEMLTRYAKTVGEKIEQAVNYVEQRPVTDIARDLEGWAREKPALFAGTAFALGFAAARFLRSSPESSSGRAASSSNSDRS